MKKVLENELNIENNRINEESAKIVLKKEICPTCHCGKLHCEFASDFFPSQNFGGSAENFSESTANFGESTDNFSESTDNFDDFQDAFADDLLSDEDFQTLSDMNANMKSSQSGSENTESRKERKKITALETKEDMESDGELTNKHDSELYHNTAKYKMITTDSTTFSDNQS